MRALLCAACLIALTAGRATAEPVTTIRGQGPSQNRVDLVILGDGYAEKDMVKYGRDVDRIVNLMFDQEPYAEYASYFNVHRVDVTSADSGIDHLESNQRKDTALHTGFGCSLTYIYYICVDFAAVNEVLARSVSPTERDIMLVIVNDTTHGGSGGAVAVASLAPESVELVLHELGHTFGRLADEYPGGGTCRTGNGREPQQPNATRANTRDALKWSAWVEPSTAVPTLTFRPGEVGAYLGADHCYDTFYRPTISSKMRTYYVPFDAVNTEQLIKRVYNYVSPIDRVSHRQTELQLVSGETVTMSVETMRPRSGGLRVEWKIDGRAVSDGSSMLLNAAELTLGAHAIELEVRDATPSVRVDPSEALVERLRWTVTVRSR